ncbi:hypothetical protein SAMN05443529_112139 [Desulfosporosinus hippei DSM 8344]|uniref:Uncharacterized protein n=1 Tax=Desulfosporosinus hippei DSM 8344 TaxID=1121419 RepID=A0A1G8BXX3_9FIRM|nr:hypothetical protein SAMN05443529_112139 [Desulfosporosinus hippei DSM 8344]
MFDRTGFKKYRDELLFIGLSVLLVFGISLLSR